MTDISNYTYVTGKSGKYHFRYAAKPAGTWDDYVTSNSYIRRIILRDKGINRTTLKLYIKLPWFLNLEFLGRYQILQDIVKSIEENNDEEFVPELQQCEVDKHLDYLETEIMESKFSYQIVDQVPLIKCLSNLGDVEERFKLHSKIDAGHTACMKYWLPRKDHGVKIEIKIHSDVLTKLKEDANYNKLLKDINEFNKVHEGLIFD